MDKWVMRSRRTARGFVYVISATNGYVKVGSGGSPFERFCTVQCNSPLLVVLSYVCECNRPVDIEVAVHERLVEHRRHREWFEVPVDLAIDAIRAALRDAGAEPIEAPHRSAKSNGARIIHRPEINETTVALLA